MPMLRLLFDIFRQNKIKISTFLQKNHFGIIIFSRDKISKTESQNRTFVRKLKNPKEIALERSSQESMNDCIEKSDFPIYYSVEAPPKQKWKMMTYEPHFQYVYANLKRYK